MNSTFRPSPYPALLLSIAHRFRSVFGRVWDPSHRLVRRSLRPATYLFRGLSLFLALMLTIPSYMGAQSVSGETHLVKPDDWSAHKFSMFIHYGLYSVAGGVWDGKPVKIGYSEQIRAFAPLRSPAEYEALARQFDPSGWQADSIVALARAAGMRSIVFTAKHHDGFCMYHTATTPYNVVDATPARRDILGELAAACRRAGMKLGIYFSLIDWHYPGALPISDHNADSIPPALHEYNKAQIRELLTQYAPVSELWFDMGSLRPEQSRELYHLVHSLQPICQVSGRLGNGYSDFAVMADNELPDQSLLVPWQTAASFYRETWGYRSWQKRISDDELSKLKLRDLVRVVGRGGNYLLNIGPRGDGSVVEQEAQVLRRMGQWLDRYGKALYHSRGASRLLPKESSLDIEATRTDSALYLFFSPTAIDRLKYTIDLDSLMDADETYFPEEAAREFESLSLELDIDRSPLSITSLSDGRNIPYERKRNNRGIRIPFKALRAWAAAVDTGSYWHILQLAFDRPFHLRGASPLLPIGNRLTADNAEPQYGYYQWDYYTGHNSIIGYAWHAHKQPHTVTYLSDEAGASCRISYDGKPAQALVLTGGPATTHHTDFDALTISTPSVERLGGTFGSLHKLTPRKGRQASSHTISNDPLKPDLSLGEQVAKHGLVYTDSAGQISGVRMVVSIDARHDMSIPVCLTFTNGIDISLNNRHITSRLINRDNSDVPTKQTTLLHLSKGMNMLVVRFFNRFADRCAYGISFPKTYTTHTIPLPKASRKIKPGANVEVSLWLFDAPRGTLPASIPSIELR